MSTIPSEPADPTTEAFTHLGENALGLIKVVRDPVSLEVSRRLLSYLLSGDIKVGTRLPSERRLADELGVGRNAIRDGLRPLALLGVLEVRPGSGTYLKSTTSDLLPEVIEWGLLLGEPSLKDLIETRMFVEVALARLTATRRTEEDLEELRRCSEDMRAAASAERTEAFTEADLRFHLQVARSAGNDVLAGILRSTRALIQVWIRRVSSVTGILKPLYREHLDVLRAIEQGDGDAAAAAMERHMAAVTARLFEGVAAERQAVIQED